MVSLLPLHSVPCPHVVPGHQNPLPFTFLFLSTSSWPIPICSGWWLQNTALIELIYNPKNVATFSEGNIYFLPHSSWWNLRPYVLSVRFQAVEGRYDLDGDNFCHSQRIVCSIPVYLVSRWGEFRTQQRGFQVVPSTSPLLPLSSGALECPSILASTTFLSFIFSSPQTSVLLELDPDQLS